MINRNTKQKEVVLDILKKNRIHPTIQEIYELAKENYPNIGKATIYRNIKKLVEEGKLLKLPNSNNESYHYDINIENHNHLLCKKCGKIIDIYDNDYNNAIKKIEKNNSIKVERVIVILEGLCGECNG